MSSCLRPTFVAAVVLCALGCGSREHLSDTYSQSSRAFFAKQHVYAQASQGAPTGLDSEESALIQARYRKSLTGSSGDTSGMEPSSRVLLLRETPNAPVSTH